MYLVEKSKNLKTIDMKAEELRDQCRDYLMGVQRYAITPEDALDALGFGKNGLDDCVEPTQQNTLSVVEPVSEEMTALMLLYAKEHCKSVKNYKQDLKLQMDAMKWFQSLQQKGGEEESPGRAAEKYIHSLSKPYSTKSGLTKDN